MFNKLKTQISEKSSSDSVPIVTNNTNKPKKNLNRIKSNQSDGNQSSDDTSSLNSNKLKTESNSNENIEKINQIESKQNEILANNENDKDTNIKTQLQQLNQSLLKQIELLTNELTEKTRENEDLIAQLVKTNRQMEENQIELKINKQKLENLESILVEFETEIKNLKNDKEELIIKNAELSEKYDLLKLLNNKQSHSENLIKHSNDNDSIKFFNSHHHSDSNHSSVNSNSENFQQYIEENKTLKDELSEKNKTIKNLQQRLNDMKKTLQKELKYQIFPNDKSTVQEIQNVESQINNNQNSPLLSNSSYLNHLQYNSLERKTSTQTNVLTSNQISPTATRNNLNLNIKKNLSNTDMTVLHEDVNFKYLKHVVIKFLTSREYEALHLIKALSVLLNLSKDEEKVIKQTLEWKMSWFGTKPKLLQ